MFLSNVPTCSDQIVYGFLTNQIVRVGNCQLVADFESFTTAGKQTSNKVEVGRVGAMRSDRQKVSHQIGDEASQNSSAIKLALSKNISIGIFFFALKKILEV